MRTVSLTVLALLGMSAEVDAKTCNALVLSGGGNNGAWEAGVMWGLLHYGKPHDFKWDVVTGVSAGSINTSMICPWKIGEEKAMTEWVSDYWANQTNEQVWNSWPGGLMEGLHFQRGLLDTRASVTTMQDTLANFPEGYQRAIAITAVDANTGEYHVFDERNTPFDELFNAVVASSSIELWFPPHDYLGTSFIDGGSVWNVNLSSAINRCREIVQHDHQITVDVMVCGAETGQVGGQPIITELSGNAFDMHNRAKDIHEYWASYDTLYTQMAAAPDVNYRYLFEEKNKTSGSEELECGNSTTWRLQEQGRADAAFALEHEKGHMFGKLADWIEDDESKKQHPRFVDYVKSFLY